MSPPIDLNELALIVTGHMREVMQVANRLAARLEDTPDPDARQIVLSDYGGTWSAYAPTFDNAVELARNCESPEWADQYAAAVRACGVDQRRVLIIRGGRAGHCRIRTIAPAPGGAS